MPELVCSAQSCVYNNAMYCSRGDIEVGGRNATVCQDTCCESFKERQGTSASNSMGTPSANADIRCEAEHCQYNQNCCSAPTMWMFQARRPVAVRRQSARHLQSDRIAKQSVYHRIKEPRWSYVLCRGMVLQGEKVCSI